MFPTKTGYDAPKTLVYALSLVLAAYIGFKILEKLKVKIDRRFALAVSPYVIFGSTLRVLQDMGSVNSILFVTPHIYTFVASVASFIFLISLFLEKRGVTSYFKLPFVFGLILLAFVIAYIKPVNFYGMLLILILFLPWILAFAVIKWDLSNKIVSSVHMLDATITFVAINFFGYGEQHIVPRFLISLLGPLSFIAVKFIAIVSILIIIDKFSKDREFNSYVKLIIGILGGATSARDFIALLSLV